MRTHIDLVAALLRSAENVNKGWGTALHRAESARRSAVLCAATAATTLLVLFVPATFAATLVTSSIDSGGGRSSAGTYINDGSVGGIGGIEGAGAETNKAGYIGQLTVVTPAPTAFPRHAASPSDHHRMWGTDSHQCSH